MAEKSMTVRSFEYWSPTTSSWWGIKSPIESGTKLCWCGDFSIENIDEDSRVRCVWKVPVETRRITVILLLLKRGTHEEFLHAVQKLDRLPFHAQKTLQGRRRSVLRKLFKVVSVLMTTQLLEVVGEPKSNTSSDERQSNEHRQIKSDLIHRLGTRKVNQGCFQSGLRRMEALEGARLVGGCGYNCLNQCCIPGICVIPGQFGFIAELNEGRHLKKRSTEFRVDKVLQPFDGSKFNFTKV
ncbi:hypothetical protein C1H46_024804 [Malus baccata]|uniref:GDPGP1-like N-terminal domain-containing protein n=1 Tax=Malus baccata TaxID=106549 RepID=A0A540LTN5_MALBA|nr:hypothetical protein C1H46_024804 [Malus baccata]